MDKAKREESRGPVITILTGPSLLQFKLKFKLNLNGSESALLALAVDLPMQRFDRNVHPVVIVFPTGAGGDCCSANFGSIAKSIIADSRHIAAPSRVRAPKSRNDQ